MALEALKGERTVAELIALPSCPTRWGHLKIFGDYGMGVRLAICIAMIFLITVISTGAQTSEPTGFLLSFTTRASYIAVEIGDGISATTYQSNVKISNTDTDGFLHKATARCIGMWPIYPTQTGEVGYCAITDEEGDKIYVRVKGDVTASGFSGVGDATGGTGKYEGIEMNFDYNYDPQRGDGQTYHSTGTLQGNYIIP